MRIVFINGAPRSGKDSAGRLITGATRFGPCISVKFAAVVKERCHAIYQIMNGLGTPAPHDYFEDVKDRPSRRFFGQTPRECYKAFSERYMKPLHGKDIFGKFLLRELQKAEGMPGRPELVLITDSGFREEAVPIVNWFGPLNCTLLRLHRQGYTYEKDSRGLIDLSDLGVLTVDVNSPDGDMEGLLENIRRRLPSFFA